jgi:hypothetical protein
MVFTGLVSAQDSSEKSAEKTPLKIYSGGLGLGAAMSINEELKDESEQFVTLSFINSVCLRDHISLFFDLNWFAPGLNFASNVGFDFFMTRSGFRPFVGLGVGVQHFDKGGPVGKDVGPSGTLHAGFLVDVTDRAQVRFRVPYYAVANHSRDHAAGFEVGVLFFGRFRNVKKLNFN